MKYLHGIAVLLLLIISCRSSKPQQDTAVKYEVNGTVMLEHQYCGGIVPESSFPKRVYARGLKMYIRKSDYNSTAYPVIDSVVSDEHGKFSVKLAAGTYCFIEAPKKNEYQVPADTKLTLYDTTCTRNEYRRCDFQLTVTNKVDSVAIVLPKYCPWSVPCQKYSGPLPPQAPPVNRGGHQPGHQE